MSLLRVVVDKDVVYEGPPTAVPRVGDEVRHNNEHLRISAVVWDFATGSGDVSVELLTGDRPYTF